MPVASAEQHQVGVARSRIHASRSASRSGPRRRPTSARCLRLHGRDRPPARGRAVRDGRRAGVRSPPVCPTAVCCPAGRIAAGASRTSACTRSGCCAASHSATLPPNEVAIRLNWSMPSAVIAAPIVAAEFDHRPCPGVLRRLSEARHFERDHPVMPAQQVVRRCQAHAAGAVQMHQRRPLARFHVADAEPVRLDEAFAERHDQISRMRGRTLRPNRSSASIIAPVSPMPGSCQRQVEHAGADLLAAVADLLDDAVGAAAEADRQHAADIRPGRRSPATLRAMSASSSASRNAGRTGNAACRSRRASASSAASSVSPRIMLAR